LPPAHRARQRSPHQSCPQRPTQPRDATCLRCPPRNAASTSQTPYRRCRSEIGPQGRSQKNLFQGTRQGNLGEVAAVGTVPTATRRGAGAAKTLEPSRHGPLLLRNVRAVCPACRH
jgi:hypothetical protein